MDQPQVTAYKIILVGDRGVGKTSLELKYLDASIFYDEVPTDLQRDRIVKQFQQDDDTVIKLEIIEVAAQDNGKFLSFHGHEVKLVDADGIFFVFDLTKKDSFENIQTWKTDVDRHVRTHKFLVGNKTDLPDRCITPVAAEDLRKKCGMVEYLEVSAKTGDGVQAMFKAVINYEKVEDKEPPPPPPAPTAVAEPDKREKMCSVC